MMITIKLSFLLSYSLVVAKPAGKKKKGKKGKKGKSKKDKASKKGKKDKSSKKSKKGKKEKVIVVVEKPKNLIEVGPSLGFSHVEYELIPGRPKYQIDVVCWGPVAKIFSVDGDVTLKTHIVKETAWVPVSMTHILHNLDDPSLLKLHSHVINYTIFTNKKKLGARAKAQVAKQFFINEKDLETNERFVEAFLTNPSLDKDKANELEEEGLEEEERVYKRKLKKAMKDILWECADTPGLVNYQEVVSRMQFLSDQIHKYQMNKIIDTVTLGKIVDCKDFVPICPPPKTEEEEDEVKKESRPKSAKSKKGGKSKKDKKSDKKSKSSKKSDKKSKKSKKSKKGKKGKKGPSDILKMSIPGEVLYTDPVLSIYDLKTPNTSLLNAFILTSAKNVMTRAQKYSLNPLIIKVTKLSNLPVQVLEENRFKEIHVHYSIPFVAQCTTIAKPLSDTVRFNEAHAYFTNTMPAINITELLQSRRLYIQVRGVRDEFKRPIETNVFGTEKNDENFDKRATAKECLRKLKEEPTIVTIAVACLDLSSLLKSTWDFKEKAPLHHPDNAIFQNTKRSYAAYDVLDKFTPNEINLNILFKSKSLSPLSESLLLEHGTTLKVEVYLSAPLNAILQVHTTALLYNRAVIIVNHSEIATTLINAVLCYNQEVLGTATVNTMYLKTPNKIDQFCLPHLGKKLPYNESALTGFIIDNGTSVIFFLEGLAYGFLANIWSQVMHCNRSSLRIFYNSDFCFEKRMYPDQLKLGGILIHVLQKSITDMLKMGAFYLEGSVPLPCFTALQKLNFMINSSSLKQIIQYNLIPTPTELLSFDAEFGNARFYNRNKSLPDDCKTQNSHVQNVSNCALLTSI